MDKKMASIVSLVGGIIGTVSYFLAFISIEILGITFDTTGLDLITDTDIGDYFVDWLIALVGLIGGILVIIFALLLFLDMDVPIPIDKWLIILIGGILQLVTVLGVFYSENMYNLDFEMLMDFFGIGYIVLIIGAIVSIAGGYLVKTAE